MSEYICGNVVCPFFKDVNSTKKKIVCEGVEKDSITVQVFKKKNAMDRHMEGKCCDKYLNCKIARILDGKYKE